MPNFYEFFAGGGMARAGLGDHWTCCFANDFDDKKGISYEANWGASGELKIIDIRVLSIDDLPGTVDLAWGSFPCQDLSLAGGGAGLKGERSGTFYPFWNLMTGLMEAGRAPRIIALENVCGTLTSHQGNDFRAICDMFANADYRYGALVIDASLFVPQSRPRLFFVGIHRDAAVDARLVSTKAHGPFHTRGLQSAQAKISEKASKHWSWWKLPTPQKRSYVLGDLIEEEPGGVRWHSETETKQLLYMMSPTNQAKVAAAMQSGKRMVGAVYKRTRLDRDGNKTLRAEIRFDDLAGCLRTPAGGSSRQTIIVTHGNSVRSRLISPRETARLMGLPEVYELPANYNEAYHLTGDGIVVPVVRHLAKNLLEPLLGIPDTNAPHAATASE